MTWIAVMLLTAAGFVLAARVFGLPRSAYALLGTALMLGLAGYALQESADLPGAPTTARPTPPQDQEALIAARRRMFGGDVPPARYVSVADGFARKGQTEDTVGFLQLAVQENPRDTEAWVALGNALVAHAQGNLTPAAAEAYGRAATIASESPAPPYFEGLALLRGGRLLDARNAWAAALERVPADASYRPIIASQLAQLNAAIAASRPSGEADPPRAQPAS